MNTDTKNTLTGILKDFPFSNERSRANQLAAMLTIYINNFENDPLIIPKPLLSMGFIIHANAPATGKTLLAKIATLPTEKNFTSVAGIGNKQTINSYLTAAAVNSDKQPYICFDNCRGTVNSSALEVFISSPIWTARVMGKSEITENPKNTPVFIIGNKLSVSEELARRCLTINLHSNNLTAPSTNITDKWLQENRDTIISQLRNITTNWKKAGRPRATGTPYPGFEEWSSIIGGIVETAGFGSILEH